MARGKILVYSVIMESYLILILCGLLLGLLSSIFGIGGGAILVPVLYILFPKFTVPQIVSISLSVIFLNTINNTYKFRKLGYTPPSKIILNFLIFAIPGAVLGTYIISYVDKEFTKKLVAVLLLFLVIRPYILPKKATQKNQTNDNPFIYSVVAFLGTLLASVTGLGGGVIFTPSFTYIAKLPLKKIPAYSNIAMLLGCLFALIPHAMAPSYSGTDLYLGNINLKIVSIIASFSLIASGFGIKVNQVIPDKTKTIVLNLIFTILAFRLILFS